MSKLFHRLLPNPFLKQVMAPQFAHLSMITMRSSWWHLVKKKEKLILIDLHLDLFSFHWLCTLWKTKYNVRPRYLHTDRANCVWGVEGQSIKDTNFKWWKSDYLHSVESAKNKEECMSCKSKLWTCDVMNPESFAEMAPKNRKN